jgi:hypothetical protein
LKVYRVNGVKQTQIHKEEPVVPEPSAVEVEMAIGKLEKKQTARFLSNTSRNVSSRE